VAGDAKRQRKSLDDACGGQSVGEEATEREWRLGRENDDVSGLVVLLSPWPIAIRASGFAYGSGRRRTARKTLKMAVFAPMPSAIVAIAAKVKTGVLIRLRKAEAKSLRTIILQLFYVCQANCHS